MPLFAPIRVLRPGDPGWDAEVSGFNLAVAQRPEAVVGATCVDDVVGAVRFASEHGLSVTVQATGHGAARPADGGLLVNTSRLCRVEVDPAARTARVGAGARWQQVVDAATPHGLAPLNGSALSVGVVGYTLGGGLGPMARTFGFAADHVRRIQLVTADGSIRAVGPDAEPELFWGLRGGKCELGIVTEIEFALLPVADYYGGALFYPGECAADVLHAYREWVGDLPDDVTSSVALVRLPDLPQVPEPLRGRLSVHLRYVHVGNPARGSFLLEPMRAAARPLLDLAERTPYAQIGSVHNDPTDPLPAWDASCLLTDLPAKAVDALLACAGPAVDVPLIVAELRHLGGAIARPPAVANAVGGRDAAFSAYVVGPLPPPLAEATPAAGGAVIDALTPWATGGTLINFQGAATAADDVRRAWDPDTRARLDALHRQWDPDRRFRFAHPTR